MMHLDPKTPIPETLSGLLELAVDDMAGLKRDRFTPDGGVWFRSNQEGVADPGEPHCWICLGGALLVGTCRLPTNAHRSQVADFTDFNVERGGYSDVGKAMFALDALRVGDLAKAAMSLYDDRDPRYKAADDLEAAGWQRERGDASELLDIRLALQQHAGHFRTWDDWDAAEPRYRRIVEILRQHGI